MMTRTIAISTLLLLLLNSLAAAQAGPNDNGKPATPAGIAVNATDRERIELDSGAGQFSALYRPDDSGSRRGGAIILPPLNAGPDHAGVIHALRTTLPDFGWATLALSLPPLHADAIAISEYAQALPLISGRIEAAIRYFKSQGVNNIALIGKGVGASAAARYLADTQDLRIQSFVGISMRGIASDKTSWLYSPGSLRKLSLPVLDIYGSLDYRDVVRSAAARGRAARLAGMDSANRIRLGAFQNTATAESAQTRRAGYIAYRQISLSGANGRYDNSEKQLVKRVIGWLKQHAGGITISQR